MKATIAPRTPLDILLLLGSGFTQLSGKSEDGEGLALLLDRSSPKW